LVLFFRKELLFLKKKKQKDFYFLGSVLMRASRVAAACNRARHLNVRPLDTYA
jgi:hypothetical protein